MWLLSCERSLLCILSHFSSERSHFSPYNQIIPREGVHLEIIKIYDFPQKAKKFWQQEAKFEPPVARTL